MAVRLPTAVFGPGTPGPELVVRAPQARRRGFVRTSEVRELRIDAIPGSEPPFCRAGGAGTDRHGGHMAKQRTTFDKLQKERNRKAKQAAKRERRQTGTEPGGVGSPVYDDQGILLGTLGEDGEIEPWVPAIAE